jgi:hypothetical protein
MKLSVYVPKRLEEKLREEAEAAEVTPAHLIQELVEHRLDAVPRRFSADFLALAGSWEDDSSTEEILRDTEEFCSSSSPAGCGW